MKSSLPPLLWLALFASTCLPRAARASCESGSQLASCIDADSAFAHASSSRFVVIRGADLERPGEVGFGIATSYLMKPITLRAPSPSPSGVDVNLVRDLVKTSFSSWVGVFDSFEAGITWPLTLYRTGAGSAPYASSAWLPWARTIVGAPRLSLAYALLSRPRGHDGVSLAARVDGLVPFIGREPFASEAGPVFALGASAELRTGPWIFGAELGVRVRESTRFANARMGSQAYLATGAAYDLLGERLAIALEAHALPVLASQPSGQPLIPAEWMLEARSAPFSDPSWSFSLGAGSSLPLGQSAITAPALRSTLILRYAQRESDAR